MTRLFIILLALVTGATIVDAASLRQQVTVDSDLVTLGDLVDPVGAKAGVAVFRAPDLGTSGVISAQRVIDAAARHGLFVEAAGIGSVTVSRPSRVVDATEIEAALREDLSRRGLLGGDSSASIRVSGLASAIHLPTRLTAPAAVTALEHDESTGTFRAQVSIADDHGGIALSVRARGRLTRYVDVPVVSRRVDRYAIIGPSDVTLKRMNSAAAPDRILAVGDIVGKSATRILRPGAPVTARDLSAPILVRRNALVTMRVRAGRLLLSAKGRALADGAAGDRIAVINAASRRVVEGVISPDGVIDISSRSSATTLATASIR